MYFIQEKWKSSLQCIKYFTIKEALILVIQVLILAIIHLAIMKHTQNSILHIFADFHIISGFSLTPKYNVTEVSGGIFVTKL